MYHLLNGGHCVKKVIALVLPSLIIGIVIGLLIGIKISDNVSTKFSKNSGNIISVDEVSDISIELDTQAVTDFEKYNFYSLNIGIPTGISQVPPDNAAYFASALCPYNCQRETFISDSGGRQKIDQILSICSEMEHAGSENEYGMIDNNHKYIATVTVFGKGKGRAIGGIAQYHLTQSDFETLYSQISDFVDNMTLADGSSFMIQDYTNIPYLDAETSIKALGLKVLLVPESNSEYEIGKVVRTEPAAGSYVNQGQIIKVYYSE